MAPKRKSVNIEDTIPKAASAAFRNARANALNSGISIRESSKGYIVETSPGGESRVIKEGRANIPVGKLKTIQIRKHK